MLQPYGESPPSVAKSDGFLSLRSASSMLYYLYMAPPSTLILSSNFITRASTTYQHIFNNRSCPQCTSKRSAIDGRQPRVSGTTILHRRLATSYLSELLNHMRRVSRSLETIVAGHASVEIPSHTRASPTLPTCSPGTIGTPIRERPVQTMCFLPQSRPAPNRQPSPRA